MTLPYTAIIYGQLYLYERKRLKITIAGDEVDLTGVTLKFKLLTEPGGEVVLEKEAPWVSLSGTDVVNVDIGGTTPQDLEDDYALIVSKFRSGVFWLELYDATTPIKIAEGYATIGPAQNPGG